MFGPVESGLDWGHLEGKGCALFLLASVGLAQPVPGHLHPSPCQATILSCPESRHPHPLLDPCLISLHRYVFSTWYPGSHSKSANSIPLLPCSASFNGSQWPNHKLHASTHHRRALQVWSRVLLQPHPFFSLPLHAPPSRTADHPRQSQPAPCPQKAVVPPALLLLFYSPGLSSTGLLRETCDPPDPITHLVASLPVPGMLTTPILIIVDLCVICMMFAPWPGCSFCEVRPPSVLVPALSLYLCLSLPSIWHVARVQ